MELRALFRLALLCFSMPALAAGDAGPPQFSSEAALEVEELHFIAGSKEELAWTPSPDAERYALYRGRSGPERPFSLDHRCYSSAIFSTHAIDRERPLPGRLVYYLATGVRRSAFTGQLEFGSLDAGGATRSEGPRRCGERVFVHDESSGPFDGLTWATAYRTLEEALAHPRTTERPVEVWVRGGTADASPLALDERGANILGAFAGTEQAIWERGLAMSRSRVAATLRGDGSQSEKFHYRFERLDFVEGAEVGVYAGGTLFEFDDVHFAAGSGVWLSGPSDYLLGVEARLRSCVMDAGFLRLSAEGDHLDLELESSRIVGDAGPALELDAHDGLLGSDGRFDILASTIIGGTSGVSLRASTWLDSSSEQSATLEGRIRSSVIAASAGHGIDAGCTLEGLGGAASSGLCRVEFAVANSTISDHKRSGLRCAAERDPALANPENYPSACVVDLDDSLITFNGDYGFEESADDPATGLVADPSLVGNFLYGNGHPYLDEGATPLSVLELNLLKPNARNQELDPLYVDRPRDDYHLAISSPAIDAASGEGHGAPVDIDGDARVLDGEGDGVAQRDVGADEVRAKRRERP